MKKPIILMCFFYFIFCVVCPTASGESGKGISLGANFGTFPILEGYNSYRYGGEVSYQISNRIGIVGEFAYAYRTSSAKQETPYYSFSSKMTYSSIPISASLVFITPIDKRFSTYIGAGLGYCEIKVVSEYTFDTESETETQKIDRIAPHFNVGIETSISKRIAIFGEVKQIMGKAKFKETEEPGYSSETDVHFGGTEVKFGIRFYFKD